jgi:hypothetical protein
VLGPLRAFGLDRLVAASEDQGAAAHAPLGRRADRVDRDPPGHRARARGGRRPAPRAAEPAGPPGGWPAARGVSTRPPRWSSRCSRRSPTAT